MSYYRGDYYAGGIGSFFGKIFKPIASMGASFIPGVGPLLSKAVSAIPTGAARSGAVASAAGAGMSIVKAGAGAIRSGIVKHPVLSAAGAAGAAGLALGAASRGMHPAVAAAAGGMTLPTRGFHISHKTGAMVRNRRMNPCNGKALRRAIRRAHAFERIAKRVIGFSSPRKPKGHMYFKRRKKK